MFIIFKTIGFAFFLSDSDERTRAMELLQDCKEEIVLPLIGGEGLLEVDVAGLEIMNDDPVKTSRELDTGQRHNVEPI